MPTAMTESSPNATGSDEPERLTPHDLVELIRDVTNDEIAEEAAKILEEQQKEWTPMALLAEAERRFSEKSDEAFANARLTIRITLDVPEFLQWTEQKRGPETAAALRDIIQRADAGNQTMPKDPLELLECAHNEAHAKEIQDAIELATARFRSNIKFD